MAGSITPWKAMASSPTVANVWLVFAHKRRGYLWGGLQEGGSTLGDGAGGGLGGRHGGSVGGTLGGAWVSVLRCSMGRCVAARVRLVGEVVVGVCAPVAENMSASCWIASMVWAPKRAKGADGAGFARDSDRRLAMSVAASAEDMAGMAPLWGENFTVLVMRSPHVSGM